MILPHFWQSNLDIASNTFLNLSFETKLDSDVVHIWYFSQNQPQECVDALQASLIEEDYLRAKKFYTLDLQNRFIVRRAIVRQMLAWYTKQDNISLVYGENGKPSIENSPICFNVSHSEDMVMLGISYHPIGLDIEAIKPISDLEQVATYHFSPCEQADLFDLDGIYLLESFYRCWTRKEAFIKLDGSGLAIPLDSFGVTLRPNDKPRLLFKNYRDMPDNNDTLVALSAPEGYIASLMIQQPEIKILSAVL